MTDRLLTVAELAEWLGISELTVRDWRADGKGPPAVKLGKGRSSTVRFRPADVEAWLDTCRESA